MTVIKIEDVWMVKNPCAFDSYTETDPVYFFILKTSSGYLQTKGMLSRGVSHILELITRDLKEGMLEENSRTRPDYELDKPVIFNKEMYPHLVVTKITEDIDAIRTMWELVS